MTIGFIDAASINGALEAVSVGTRGTSPDWDKQCLLRATFLLMHSSMKVLPTVEGRATATGDYEHVISAFPQIETYAIPEDRRQAQAKTKAWLSNNLPLLSTAWDQLQHNNRFCEWADRHKAQALVRHVKRHGSLFEVNVIQYICRILNCSERDLRKVHCLSVDTDLVGKWERGKGVAEDIQLAEKAWLLAGIMRGKFHEYFAEAQKLQLAAHPFREGIERKLIEVPLRETSLSEELFVRMIIGAALIETSRKRRVTTWVNSTRKASDAIIRGGIALPDVVNESDAERYAADAAKAIGLQCSPDILRRAIDIAFTFGLAPLLHLTIAPWAAVMAPIIPPAYRHVRGAAIGDDVSTILLSTRSRFLALAKSVPGRIAFSVDTIP